MSDEAERWKEKYLKSIEQQDKLELRWNARLDLLRRGLVRSSLAAEGADKAVDQCMKEMREIVRKDDMDAGLAALIPRLETAVLESEQRREQRVEQMGSALTSLVTQLQSLPLPKEVSKPLKRFAKSLEERINQARELPLILSELSGLQGKALSQMEHAEGAARPGFLQRLFGSREGEDGAESHALAHPESHKSAAVQAPDKAEVEPEQDSVKPQAHWSNEAPAQAEPGTQAPVVEKLIQPATAHAEPEVVKPVPVEPLQPQPESVEVEAAVVPVDAKADENPEPEPTPQAESVSVEAPLVEADEPDAVELPVSPVENVVTQELATDHVVSEESAEPAEQSAEKADDAEGDDIEQELTEEEGSFALPSSPEPSYSSVAAHIEETLLGLLGDLTLPEHHRPQAEAMRARLEHGLNWYELLPILDDLAVLMLAITDSGQHEFELYLKQLNERLESFQSNLKAASDDHADNQSTSRQLDDQLRLHVDGLQSSMQEAADLDGLKQVLESRLEGLLGTMDQHQQQRDDREQEVANRLQALVGRVATMEQEAQGFRVHLEEQRQKALIDTLTGLPNRAAWNERLDQEIEQLQQTRSNLLMGILDLDHFKRINDNYGHLAGDRVLKIIAAQLKQRLRGADFIARFGGEEFVVLLPQTSMSDGLALLERLRAAIEECPFHFKGERVTITVSIGITLFKAGERSDLVLKRADQALYRAKDEGRNRIVQG